MGTRILQVANFYSSHSGGLRTTVDALGRAYVDAGLERVLVVPGPADADEDTPAGRRITLRGPKLPGSGGYRALAGTGACAPCSPSCRPSTSRSPTSSRWSASG